MKTIRDLLIPLAAVTAVVAGLAHGAPANAAEPLPFEAELEACVDEIASRIDLRDATRVRHTIIRQSRKQFGYELTIDSAVYAGGTERHYKARCLARGGTPLSFQIREQDV